MKVTKIYPDSDGLFDVDDRYLMVYFPEEDSWELNPYLHPDLRSSVELFLLSSEDWFFDLQRLGVEFSDVYEFYSDEDEDTPYQVLYYDCGLDCFNLNK